MLAELKIIFFSIPPLSDVSKNKVGINELMLIMDPKQKNKVPFISSLMFFLLRINSQSKKGSVSTQDRWSCIIQNTENPK